MQPLSISLHHCTFLSFIIFLLLSFIQFISTDDHFQVCSFWDPLHVWYYSPLQNCKPAVFGSLQIEIFRTATFLSFEDDLGDTASMEVF